MGKTKGKDDGEHIDVVFDPIASKKIEEAYKDARYSTRSEWMRQAIDFVLMLREDTNLEDVIVVRDKEGQEKWKVDVKRHKFLSHSSPQDK